MDSNSFSVSEPLPLEQALLLARQGFRVFPLHPLTKHPAINGWQDRASNGESAVRAMPWRPNSNIGIATGIDPSAPEDGALVVIDLDNTWGQKDVERQLPFGKAVSTIAFSDACKAAQSVNGFRLHTSASDGLHLYIRVVGEVPGRADLFKTKTSEGWAVDVKAKGGFIVAPGSRAPKKADPTTIGSYAIANGTELSLRDLPLFSLDELTALGLPMVTERKMSGRASTANRNCEPNSPDLRGALFYLIDNTPADERTTYDWWLHNILLPLAGEAALASSEDTERDLGVLYEEACDRAGGNTANNPEQWVSAVRNAKEKI